MEGCFEFSVRTLKEQVAMGRKETLAFSSLILHISQARCIV
jgi:hypothetical protein